MPFYIGPQKWWKDKQNPPPSGELVLDLDAGNPTSYPGSGTTWTDLSGNNYNGTLVNGVGYDSANSGSLVFDGSDDYVTLGTPALLSGYQIPLTIIGWAYLTSYSGLSILYGNYLNAGGGDLYNLFRVDNNVLKYYASDSNGSYQFQGTFTPTLNTWNFYAVVVSGTIASPTVKIFLNQNSEVFSYQALYSPLNPAVETRIGANAQNLELWPGKISRIRFYNKALTDQEITENYNLFTARYGV